MRRRATNRNFYVYTPRSACAWIGNSIDCCVYDNIYIHVLSPPPMIYLLWFFWCAAVSSFVCLCVRCAKQLHGTAKGRILLWNALAVQVVRSNCMCSVEKTSRPGQPGQASHPISHNFIRISCWRNFFGNLAGESSPPKKRKKKKSMVFAKNMVLAEAFSEDSCDKLCFWNFLRPDFQKNFSNKKF